jgi:hypothetical protein
MSPEYKTIALNKVEDKLVRLALEKKGAADQRAAAEFAEAVTDIPAAHEVAPGSRVEFGADKPGGPIVMRVHAGPAPDGATKRPKPAPAPPSVRAGKRGKR